MLSFKLIIVVYFVVCRDITTVKYICEVSAMGKILGIAIKNYGSLKDIKMGQLYSGQTGVPLGNMVAIIGPSGNGKSTLADAFGFIADALTTDVESACDASNRGGYDKLVSQGSNGPIHFEIYYKENSNSRPITYELTIGKDKYDRPYVKDERLRQRRPGNKSGRPLSFLYLIDGKGYAFEGAEGGQDDEGVVTGSKVDVELSDIRKLGIVTLGAMKQYSRIEKFLTFLKSWYLCYFTPDTARQIQTAAPAPYLNRTGSNLNNVAQFMYRENPGDFKRILTSIQTKIPNIKKIEPVKLKNGQMVLDHVFCLAVEEIEAWLLGDRHALLSAYPHAKMHVLNTYVQDSICGTWEVLADAVYPGGTSKLSREHASFIEIGKLKAEWAQNIGIHMDLKSNESPSFNDFIHEIERRLVS